MKRWMFVAVFALAGCHDAPTTAPTSVAVADGPRSTTAAVCSPFDIEWDIDRNMAGPKVFVRPKATGVASVQVDIWDGATWELYAAAPELLFERQYRVRGMVNGCWSNWYEFVVGPASGTTADATPAATPEPPLPGEPPQNPPPPPQNPPPPDPPKRDQPCKPDQKGCKK